MVVSVGQEQIYLKQFFVNIKKIVTHEKYENMKISDVIEKNIDKYAYADSC